MKEKVNNNLIDFCGSFNKCETVSEIVFHFNLFL